MRPAAVLGDERRHLAFGCARVATREARRQTRSLLSWLAATISTKGHGPDCQTAKGHGQDITRHNKARGGTPIKDSMSGGNGTDLKATLTGTYQRQP